MDNNNQEARAMRLWIVMIVVAIAVIIGWIFLLRHNFAKINAEMNSRGESMEQAAQEMEATFKKMEEIIQSLKAKSGEISGQESAVAEELKKGAEAAPVEGEKSSKTEETKK